MRLTIVAAVIRKRLLSGALTAVMLTAAVGVGAHQQEGWCPMLKLPDCCKKARSNGPGASIARVCCKLNCSEPASTENTTSLAVQLSTTANTAMAMNAAQKVVFTPRSQRFHAYDSHPRYLKHLALLI
ncbi:MAG TPA: hypothetical protein VFD75_13360 [Pyrinomonadaceae bacterium]|nr:hypothetical protein [Pyrinomonadaceae bacterium]